MNEKRIIGGLKEIISTCNWWALLFGLGWVFVYYLHPEDREQNHYGIWFIVAPLVVSGMVKAFVKGYEKKI